MVTLTVLSALFMQVAVPGEMSCIGFIRDAPIPMNLIVVGTEEDETNNFSHTGRLLYVNGPGVPGLKVGDRLSVVRPEGKIKDLVTGEPIGIYHKEVGSVRIDAVTPDVASASVVDSCSVILKGDLLVPIPVRQSVQFRGPVSDRLTPYADQGLVSTVVLGKDGLNQMAVGNFCFIGIGSRDGVKPGDRFTVYRPQPPFNPAHLDVDGSMAGLSYEKVSAGRYRRILVDALARRTTPPRVLGDVVVVDVSDTTAAVKIINSLSEIHVGDVVARR